MRPVGLNLPASLASVQTRSKADLQGRTGMDLCVVGCDGTSQCRAAREAIVPHLYIGGDGEASQ